MNNIFEAIQSHINKFAFNMYTACLAKVVAVNKKDNGIVSLDVKPQIVDVYRMDNLKVPKPIIYDVPFVLMAGGGSFVSFPIAVGDPVLLLFSQEDIDNYRNIGVIGEPNTLRRFNINDAIALPCVFPDKLLPHVDPDKLNISFGDTNITMEKSGDINITSATNVNIKSNSEVTVEAPTINVEASSINLNGNVRVEGSLSVKDDVSTDKGISLNSHKHAGVKTGGGVTGAPQ